FSAQVKVRGKRRVTYCSLGTWTASPFTCSSIVRSLWLKKPTWISARGSARCTAAGTRNCSTAFPPSAGGVFFDAPGLSFFGNPGSGSVASPGSGRLSFGMDGSPFSSFGLSSGFGGMGDVRGSESSRIPAAGFGGEGGGAGGSGAGAGAPQIADVSGYDGAYIGGGQTGYAAARRRFQPKASPTSPRLRAATSKSRVMRGPFAIAAGRPRPLYIRDAATPDVGRGNRARSS